VDLAKQRWGFSGVSTNEQLAASHMTDKDSWLCVNAIFGGQKYHSLLLGV
jgi:hypothetical protein